MCVTLGEDGAEDATTGHSPPATITTTASCTGDEAKPPCRTHTHTLLDQKSCHDCEKTRGHRR